MSTDKKANSESTESREIIITRVFDAPRELVWEAMTDPRHIAHWWGPRGFTTTTEIWDFSVGGKWNHVMRGPDGTEYPNFSVFKEIVKPERIVYSHGGGEKGAKAVSMDKTWTLDVVEKNKTRVTIHMIFPTAEERDHVVKNYGAIEGGKQTLERLSEHLPKMDLVAKEFRLERVFDAPRELVWKAWTDPKQMAQWWGPHNFVTPVCNVDVRPDGAYRIVMRATDGREFPLKGVFREVVEPERLVMTMDCSEHAADWHDMVKPNRTKEETNPAGVFLTTVTFESLGCKTRLTISTLFDTATIRDAMVKMGMNDGWSQSLDKLATLLAHST